MHSGCGVLRWKCLYVCLSVCMHISETSLNFLCMLPVTVAYSSSGGIVIHYEVLVLWMTSCFAITGLWWRDATTALFLQCLVQPKRLKPLLHDTGCILSCMMVSTEIMRVLHEKDAGDRACNASLSCLDFEVLCENIVYVFINAVFGNRKLPYKTSCINSTSITQPTLSFYLRETCRICNFHANWYD